MKSKMIKTGTLMLALLTISFVNAQGKKKSNPEKKFKKIDTNNDGRISLVEYKNKKTRKKVSVKKLTKKFKKIDANSNGFISLIEFKKSSNKR